MQAIIMLIIFSPALAFLVGRTLVKYKALQLQSGVVSPQTLRRIDALERDNDELRRRLETLETIATGMDARAAGMEGALHLKTLEHQQEAAR